jgi:prepilin signal peptidase PulO-like enzyme (type II secretory pathway)
VTLSVLARDPKVVMGAVIAAALAGGGFWFLEVASKGRAMGGGDTKLAFAMGLILGVQGTAIALFLAFDVAAVVGLIMIGAHRRRRTDLIPFGPYLVGGTVLAYLFGRAIVNWYLQMNGVSL